MHKDEFNICFECDNTARWVRTTQFAGNHYYCSQHAVRETDFWETPNDWCYINENGKLQDAQSSPQFRSIQALGNLEEVERSKRRAKVKAAFERSRRTSSRT